MEAAGFERFSVFGYSFTGAFAPWLAHLTGRVDAVVSGGFPIAGDYSPLYPEILALSAAAEADPAGLDCHGLKHASFPGHQHEGMLAHVNEAVPSVLAWFDGLLPAE